MFVFHLKRNIKNKINIAIFATVISVVLIENISLAIISFIWNPWNVEIIYQILTPTLIVGLILINIKIVFSQFYKDKEVGIFGLELQHNKSAWQIIWPRLASKTIVTLSFLIISLITISIFGAINDYSRVYFLPYFLANSWSLILIDFSITILIILFSIIMNSNVAILLVSLYGIICAFSWFIAGMFFPQKMNYITLGQDIREKKFIHDAQSIINKEKETDNFLRNYYIDDENKTSSNENIDILKEYYGFYHKDNASKWSSKSIYLYENFGKIMHDFITKDEISSWKNTNNRSNFKYDDYNSKYHVNYEYKKIINMITKENAENKYSSFLNILNISKKFYDEFFWLPFYDEKRFYINDVKKENSFYANEEYSPGEGLLNYSLNRFLVKADKGIANFESRENNALKDIKNYFKINPLYWIMNLNYGSLSTSFNNKYNEFSSKQFWPFKYVEMIRNKKGNPKLDQTYIFGYEFSEIKTTSSYIGNAVSMIILNCLIGCGTYFLFRYRLRE